MTLECAGRKGMASFLRVLACTVIAVLLCSIQLLSSVRAYGTGRGVFTREDFWFIVVSEGNEDETEIHARQ